MNAVSPAHIASYRDLPLFRERVLYRLLEIFPGLLSIGTLVLMIVLSWRRPVWIAIFIIIYDTYWLIRITYYSVFLISAYRKMRTNLSVDWLSRLKKTPVRISGLNSWRDIYHLVIFPMYREPEKVIRESLLALARVTYPKEKILVVLAVEERDKKNGLLISRKMSKEFGRHFGAFLTTIHPKDLPGEIPAKGANMSWALKKALKKIIVPCKIDVRQVLVSGLDSDTQVFPEYFARLGYVFLNTPRPYRASYQPIPLFHNNIWEVPLFSRLVSIGSTFWHMILQEQPKRQATFSSHAIPLKTLLKVGLWQKNIVSEDSRIFYQCFLHYHGDYRVRSLYYPVSMDANIAKNFWQTAKNLYRQQRRHAWGVENIPFLIYGFWKQRGVPWRKALYQALITIEGFFFWATASLLILLLGWLPLVLGEASFQSSILSYNLPRITSILMSIAMIGLAVNASVTILLLPSPSTKTRVRSRALMVIQWALMPVVILIFGAFPAIEAQARLMLNRRLGFWPTQKYRRNH